MNPKITPQQLAQLKQIPIESVARSLGMRVVRHKALCFMHDDHHPSLAFNVSRNTWRCFVCDKGGDSISLVMERNGQSFVEACQWLGAQFGIFSGGASVAVRVKTATPTTAPSPASVIPADAEIIGAIIEHCSLTEKARKFLFKQRRYTPEAIESLGICALDDANELLQHLLTKFSMQRLKQAQLVFENRRNPANPRFYFHTPCLFFPYYNEEGKLVNLQARYLGGRKNTPRFQFLKGIPTGIFNLQVLKHVAPTEPLFIAEGVTDAIALTSCGYKAIAIPSATTAKEEDLERLAAHTLLMYPDNDAPGEALYQKVKNAVDPHGGHITRLLLPPATKDFSDLYLASLE
ncbi:MAG: CHC2 zinc finger domain-containing protein [Bacteroidales bacterium]|nr:CHC2 zinc finger domain-containing protein [Bacteroidales bacterium]